MRLRVNVLETVGFGDFINNEARCGPARGGSRAHAHRLRGQRRSPLHCGVGRCAATPSWKPVVHEIDERFDAYLDQERRVHRQGMLDSRIHCCLYFIPPTGHAYGAPRPRVRRRWRGEMHRLTGSKASSRLEGLARSAQAARTGH